MVLSTVVLTSQEYLLCKCIRFCSLIFTLLSLPEYRKKGSGGGEASGAENRVPCSATSGPLGEKQVCDVPVDNFHPCTSANQYNYEAAGPCVFLKLNKVRDLPPSIHVHMI